MSEPCEWLHRQLESLPVVRYPFQLDQLPDNGIYAFYQSGESWGHGGDTPRIVRIGTHRDGNFHSRIKEHYRLNDSTLVLDRYKPAPKDRSIFRKNLGRALLNQRKDPYLQVWELDFTSRKNRDQYGHLRDLDKELQIESQVTELLRRDFSFRYVVVDQQAERMGTGGLEAALIGTLSHCGQCRPSRSWLGLNSPKPQIVGSGLWLVQHLDAPELNQTQAAALEAAISATRRWVEQRGMAV